MSALTIAAIAEVAVDAIRIARMANDRGGLVGGIVGAASEHEEERKADVVGRNQVVAEKNIDAAANRANSSSANLVSLRS
jgi:hypothetical protein